MICQEVVELMQRYLDQDLEEIEYKQMLSHLQACQDCTELFQRLITLSHELGQLPKVIPAYSLVDAILPKLQQIDQGHPVEDLFAAGFAAAPLAADGNISQLTDSPVDEISDRRKRMRGLFSTRMIGGVVAAGLVLGFFVFEQQQQQGSLKEAGDMLLPAAASQQKAAGNSKLQADSTGAKAPSYSDSEAGGNPVNNSTEPQNFGANPADPNAPMSPLTGSNTLPLPSLPGNAAGQANPGNPAGNPGSGNAPAAPQAPAPAGPNTTAKPPADQPQSNDAAQGPAALQPPVQQQQQPPAGDRQTAATASPPATAAPDQPTDLTTKSAINGNAPGATPAPSQSQPSELKQEPAAIAPGTNDQAAGKRTSKSISAFGVPEENMTTADGAYTASISSDKFVVIKDKQGKQIFTSSRKAADTEVLVLIGWDNYKLTYEIRSSARTSTYILNMADKTEIKK